MGNDAIAIVCGYLIGALPTAYIVGRLLKGIDIRDVGSRNMGAMNVIFQVGPFWGILVLFVDMAKGTAVVILARYLDTSLTVELVAGAVAIAGHAFPVYLKFRGGKGGATALGVLAFMIPQAIPYYLAILVILMVTTRFLTLSYSLAFLSAPVVCWLVYDSATLVIYSSLLILVLAVRYIPRLKQMRSAAGGWRRVFLRSSLKDRF